MEQPSHFPVPVPVSVGYVGGYLATSSSGRILKKLNKVHQKLRLAIRISAVATHRNVLLVSGNGQIMLKTVDSDSVRVSHLSYKSANLPSKFKLLRTGVRGNIRPTSYCCCHTVHSDLSRRKSELTEPSAPAVYESAVPGPVTVASIHIGLEVSPRNISHRRTRPLPPPII